MKLVQILFVILLLIFPLGQVGRLELGGGLNILLNDIVVFFVVAAWIAEKIPSRKAFLQSELTLPMALFAGTCALSLLINGGRLMLGEILVASLYLVRWIMYAGLFFVVRDFSKSFQQKVLFGLLLSGVFLVFIGFVQYFLYPNLRNLYYAGWDDHLYRLFSSFLDPNFVGGIFVLTFLLAFSQFNSVKHSISKLGLGVAMASTFIALIFTYSRGSFLSFLAGGVSFLFLTAQKRISIVFVLILVLGIFLLPKDLKSEGVELLRTASINERIKSAENAVTLFKENPVFGVGFNAYRYAQLRHGFLTYEEGQMSHSGAGTDNSFLFVLATTGVVGLAAYVYLWFRIIQKATHAPLLLAAIIAIFVHALFVNSLFYPWVMEWFWILIAVTRVGRSL